MKPMMSVLMLCLGIAVGASVVYFSTPNQAAPEAKIGLSEVSDLIARLKPLAHDPESSWRGVKVSFTGSSASIDITMKDGTEYTAKAATLKETVAAIDSGRIRAVLQGWNGN